LNDLRDSIHALLLLVLLLLLAAHGRELGFPLSPRPAQRKQTGASDLFRPPHRQTQDPGKERKGRKGKERKGKERKETHLSRIGI
jgi:hypothetical protein